MAINEMGYRATVLMENLDQLFKSVVGAHYYTKAKLYALHHPFVFTAIVTTILFSAIPMLFFLGFIITTLAFALVCFFCIEGSLIAISGLIFIGVVSFISIIVGAILLGMASFVWVLQKIGVCMSTCSSVRQIISTTDAVDENDQNSSEE